MRKVAKNPLALRGETIRQLAGHQLSHVNGGMVGSWLPATDGNNGCVSEAGGCYSDAWSCPGWSCC